ncbi:DUF418 domain-containing protein [Nocardiopsis flavescens]|uniref:Uncharacterized membrane protein YeiB n=1 Tax=Nocardiopsis flavescens TaxID=758803 RepID=A0A1M6IJE1_9ACTN|nr:DUF418 domain-containing protein [Nocardiopsis flavescens]SHJ34554.1 Uncharacterized membrane protein YeiB [Nocardiopsis flavescens]
MPSTRRPPTAGVHGTDLSGRAIAPDLARGVMLLVIAVVHAHIFRLMAGGDLTGTPAGVADTVTTMAVLVLAEARGYPMFAALFGYGLAWIYLRRIGEGRSWPWVRALVRRRGRWMVAIGLAHVVLLFFGDIISVYGLIALLFAGLLHVGDRRLLAHGFAWMAAGSLVYALGTTLPAAASAESGGALSPDPLADLLTRLMTWPFMTPLLLVTSVFPFVVGVWAARRRVMERPQDHLGLLRRTAGIGIPLAVLGGLPRALAVAGLWSPSSTAVDAAAAWLHVVTGYAGGFGYAALIALVAVRLGGRRGPVVRALVATGQRSMTCYLLQSVAWMVLFMPYTLDLGSGMSDTASVLVGAGVWAATVVVADLMRRFGVRGPAERFLRWCTYAPVRHDPVDGRRPERSAVEPTAP